MRNLGTSAGVRDPDGNKINVISDPAWPQTANNYFKVDGIFIGVSDIERTHAWYADTLGADVEYDFTYPTDTLPEARHICYLGVNPSPVESTRGILRGRVCDFVTADAAADYAYLQAKNVHVTAIMETDGHRAFTFHDVDGREFGLVENG